MKARIKPSVAIVSLAFFAGTALSAHAQQAPSELEAVLVQGSRQQAVPLPVGVEARQLAGGRVTTSDTAVVLQDVPGVSLVSAGGVSGLPVIHGLADDRLRISVDGMDLISSCPNHMNPPLSYLPPASLGQVRVYAGIVPVSVGGDSIGGAIVAESLAPRFAASGQGLLTEGEVGATYRSNNNALLSRATATVAGENFTATYSGSAAEANNYKAGGDFKSSTATGRTGHSLALDEVGSTAYKSLSHLLGLAWRADNHLLEAKFAYQDIPYELYPNQRMDMLDNQQQRFSLRYLGQFPWCSAEVRAYNERVRHFMEFGGDKKFAYTTGNTTQGMPMHSEGKTSGVSSKFSVELTPRDILSVGAEFQHYTLSDWWPAVTGSAGMGPNDFLNINDGKRDRLGIFGELEKQFDAQWSALLGTRYEQVRSDSGAVHGYNTAAFPTALSPAGMMNQNRDAALFNNAGRSRRDGNWDVSTLARYAADPGRDVEFGLARKVRSPNLYERYTWSTANMMSIMNNFVGDANGYIGNPDLKPETAYTAALTVDWHAADRNWEFRATPYFTHVENYIDAIQWNGSTNSARTALLGSQYVTLKYVNQTARLYGLDLSGHLPLGRNALGDFSLSGKINYVRGENRETGGDLYNIMPLSTKLVLDQQSGGWNNSLEFVAVDAKRHASVQRNEVRTSGYALTNLHASYSWSKVRLDFGVDNLFNKFYFLPAGGAYVGQGSTMSINPADAPWGTAVPGMGRSIYAGLSVKF